MSTSKHDLFISYTHVDNEKYDSDQRWIDLLHDRLEKRLTMLLGKKHSPDIWRDLKMTGSDVIHQHVFTKISNSELLLSVLSPSYLQSEWCPKELDAFYQQAVQAGTEIVDGKLRIVKVVKTPIKREDHPAELQGTLGYEFYEFDSSGRFQEYLTDAGANRDRRYWNKLEDLAQDLKDLIVRIRQDPPSTVMTSPSGKTIFLAETTADLKEQHDRIRRELQQNGHRVLPENTLPNTWHIRDEVRQMLDQCQLAIHLVGTNYGVVPEGETLSIAEIQHELAAVQKHRTDFSQILWMPIGITPTDERQQRFINALLDGGTDLLQNKLEDLKDFISDKLNPPKSAIIPSGTNGNGQHKSKLVYLCCDQLDNDAVAPIEKLLYERGFDVMPSSHMNFDDLRICDALLVYCGNTTDEWLNIKKSDLFKLRGYERTTPLLAKAFYISAPQTNIRERFHIQDGFVIKNYGEFAPAELMPFIEQLEKGSQS